MNSEIMKSFEVQ